MSIEALTERIRAWRAETAATIVRLLAHREQVDANSAQLENPRAVADYLDFFTSFFERAVADFDSLAEELSQHISPAHSEVLARMASDAAAHERRCLHFRDTCINRPLAFEQQRGLLNRISADTHDQLVGYRGLVEAAVELTELARASAAASQVAGGVQSPGRRALFTRWFEQ
jgi:hypothetical protein